MEGVGAVTNPCLFSIRGSLPFADNNDAKESAAVCDELLAGQPLPFEFRPESPHRFKVGYVVKRDEPSETNERAIHFVVAFTPSQE